MNISDLYVFIFISPNKHVANIAVFNDTIQ